MKATEDYVSFETAKALRAIGFNCPCCHYYKRSKWVRRGRFPSKKISPQMYKGYADLIKEAPKIEFINDEGITNQRLTGNESPRMDWADEFVMPHYEYATAPTLWQAQKWLREVHNIDMNVDLDDETDEPYTVEIYRNKQCVVGHRGLGLFSTYEQALSKGIETAIKVIEEV